MVFDVMFKDGRTIESISLNMPGDHNVQNALAAIAIADYLEVKGKAINKGLSEFAGVGRRFQHMGELEIDGKSVTLIDDYGHHPRELAATLKAANGCWPNRRVVAVFQPHRYTRTHELFDDFVIELAETQCLVICEVYAAGEDVIAGADGRSLSRAIRDRGKTNPIFVPELVQLDGVLSSLVAEGDVVLTLGAGSIGKASIDLANKYSESINHG